jgi:hypothetical protein
LIVHEIPHDLCRRLIENVIARAILDNPPVVQNYNALGEGKCLFQVVRYENSRPRLQ